MEVSSTSSNFCSKHVIRLPDNQFVTHRQGVRTIQGGNYSNCRHRPSRNGAKPLTQGEFNTANTLSLLSWGIGLPLIESYIQRRLDVLDHTMITDRIKEELSNYPFITHARRKPIQNSEFLDVLNMGATHIDDHSLDFKYIDYRIFTSKSLFSQKDFRSLSEMIHMQLVHDIETNPGPSLTHSLIAFLCLCVCCLSAMGVWSSPTINNFDFPMSTLPQKQRYVKKQQPMNQPRRNQNFYNYGYPVYRPRPRVDATLKRAIKNLESQFSSLKGSSFSNIANAYKTNTDFTKAIDDLPPTTNAATFRNLEHAAMIKMIDVGLADSNMTPYEKSSTKNKIQDLAMLLLDD